MDAGYCCGSEGFAFFRWHCLKYGYQGDACPGYGRCGVGCCTFWDNLQGRAT